MVAPSETKAVSMPGARSNGPRRGGFLTALLVAPAVVWLVVFGLAPLVVLVLMSFWQSTIFGLSTEFTLDNYRLLLADPVYALVIMQTLRIAVSVTVISLLVSYPIAYFIASTRGTRRTLFLLLLFIPFWSSYVVRTFVWLPMLGRGGLVNNALIALGIVDHPLDWLLYNEAATQIGLVYIYILFMTLPIYLSLDRIDKRLVEAAADLGAGPVRSFTRVVLPLSMSGVISGSVVVFLLSMGVYVTPQLLGGTTGVMMGNIIAAQYTNTNNWALGAALSATLIAVIVAVLIVCGRRFRLEDVFIKG
jgi:spermidine/putrescine transport system permease protein